jgi:hypothetical protein
MKIRNIHLQAFIIVALAVSSFMLASFIRARSVADEIMLPILDSWYYSGTQFLPVGFKNQKEGPSWRVLYDAREVMVTSLFSVQVSIFGKVIDTNPPGLRKEIEEQLRANASTSDSADGLTAATDF